MVRSGLAGRDRKDDTPFQDCRTGGHRQGGPFPIFPGIRLYHRADHHRGRRRHGYLDIKKANDSSRGADTCFLVLRGWNLGTPYSQQAIAINTSFYIFPIISNLFLKNILNSKIYLEKIIHVNMVSTKFLTIITKLFLMC